LFLKNIGLQTAKKTALLQPSPRQGAHQSAGPDFVGSYAAED